MKKDASVGSRGGGHHLSQGGGAFLRGSCKVRSCFLSLRLKKRGVGMVVGAPRCTRYSRASDGSAGVRGNEGPSLKPDLNPSKPVPSTRIRTAVGGSLDLFD